MANPSTRLNSASHGLLNSRELQKELKLVQSKKKELERAEERLSEELRAISVTPDLDSHVHHASRSGKDFVPLEIRGIQQRGKLLASEKGAAETHDAHLEYIDIIRNLEKNSSLGHETEHELLVAIKSMGMEIPKKLQAELQHGLEISQRRFKERKRPATSQGTYRTDDSQRESSDKADLGPLEVKTLCSTDCTLSNDIPKKRVSCKKHYKPRLPQPANSGQCDFTWVDGLGLVDTKLVTAAAKTDSSPFLNQDENVKGNMGERHWLSSQDISKKGGRDEFMRKLENAKAQLASANVHLTQLNRKSRLCFIEANTEHTLSLGRLPARPVGGRWTWLQATEDQHRSSAKGGAGNRNRGGVEAESAKKNVNKESSDMHDSSGLRGRFDALKKLAVQGELAWQLGSRAPSPFSQFISVRPATAQSRQLSRPETAKPFQRPKAPKSLTMPSEGRFLTAWDNDMQPPSPMRQEDEDAISARKDTDDNGSSGLVS